MAYSGGAEHAVLHLLYARFWHKVLFDLGVVSTPEPFHRLVSQGMILGEVRPCPLFGAYLAPWSEAGTSALYLLSIFQQVLLFLCSRE